LAGISATSYYFKVVLVSIFLALIISVSFLIYGFYFALTVPVAAQGGTIREGFVGTEINVFNPVLDLNPVETRIATLLFYPLYKVDYPDYLASQENPKITPILLEKAPEWLDYNNENPQNRYKLLRFTLKEGLKWSNGSEITTDDIEYTVERLREDRGNSSFREILRKLEFEKLNKRDFIFRSKESNPGLIYALNFQPIPQKYFNFLSTAELLVDNRSRKPMVTSGLFKFPEGLVQHPNESKTMLVDNPIRDSEGRNMILVLERNSVQNYDQPTLVQNYIFTRYDSLLEIPNQTGFSLEKGAISGRVDFFTRSVTANPTTELSSENIQKFLKLNQKVLPTNTYYIAFFNTELGIRQNYTGYLINKSLRRYIACYLLDYQPNTKYANFVDLIPKDKRLVPPQLNVSYLPENCDRREAELDSFYSINKDERTGIKKVLLEGKEIRLVMLGLAELIHC
jgi:Bacterial extracellular solute-binding proteins, family 5 Middle.